MPHERLRLLCLSLPEVTEDMPFGDDILAFRVHGKIFALLALDASPPSVNLKADPAWAVELRDQYPAVKPGYHMNKTHWNTVVLDGSIPQALVTRMVRHSWELIVKSLRKSDRDPLLAQLAADGDPA